jgi:hypothetical protein
MSSADLVAGDYQQLEHTGTHPIYAAQELLLLDAEQVIDHRGK